ncbi:hypothetical protein [Streptomonospora litoralis]|uniref:Uncharacterized protein n=1 Tax=Streptomonospora litoralis TaxID=2498135 RepID=A0A4P6Q1D7_9ACTN|nr:hypothetical protein [Streptomonospora litoralis]QBI53041.1 hypothetical protein EKD16_06215 [Streptomonospora litoralis]
MTTTYSTKVPPSPAGIGIAVRATAYGAVLLGITLAIALGMPQAHGLSRGTASVLIACSIAWGLAQAPLTVRWVRGKRMEPIIHSRMQALQPHPGVGQREAERLLRQAGISNPNLELLGIPVGVVLATVSASFLAEDPSSWITTWNWATFALPALWAISSVARFMLMLHVSGSAITGNETGGFCLAVLFLGLPLMLLLPSTALLFLTAGGAVRFAVTGVETHRSRSDRIQRLHTAVPTIVPGAGVHQIAEFERFLAEAPRGLVQHNIGTVHDALERIAVERPGRVMRILSRTPHLATADALAPVIRSWAGGVSGSDFDGCWDALQTLLGGAAPTHQALAAALAGLAPERISPEFRRKAALHVFSDIDADADTHVPGTSAWQLLETLAPAGAPTTIGDWWCTLACAAADRGDDHEAQRRFRAAIQAGCATAERRLAHHLACLGHRALKGNDPRAADYLAEAVRLEDAVDYRLLLLLARAVRGSTAAAPAALVPAEDALESWPSRMWTAAAVLSHLRSGAAGSAKLLAGAERLSDADDPEVSAAVSLICGVLTGDTHRLASGARALVRMHGSDWVARVPLDPVTVLSRIVDAPDVLATDSALPEVLLYALDSVESAELTRIRAVLAHRMTAEAALAADENRLGPAQERLEAAAHLLERAQRPLEAQRLPAASETGTKAALARLREAASELRAHLHNDRPADQLAYDQLTIDGEQRPWTLDAQRTWEKGGGVWRDHHLAVAYHARAYELEQLGLYREAHRYWTDALQRWARVVDSDGFWQRMDTHLAAAMGTEPPGDLLQSVRTRLPRDLLEPNLARAVELQAERPDHARLHMTAVRESGLPVEAVAAVRREFADQVALTAMRDVRAGRYDAGVNAVESYLIADPTNPRLVEVLLYAVRLTVSSVFGERPLAGLHDFQERIRRLVHPYIEETGDGEQPDAEPEIRRELARFEFFCGLVRRGLMMEAQETPSTAISHAAAGVAHLEDALRHDPELTDDASFNDAEELLTMQRVYAAYFAQKTRHGDSAVRMFLAPALRALGTDPDPAGQPELAALVVAHMASSASLELAQARELVAHLVSHPDTPQRRMKVLDEIQHLLALRAGAILR